tara:strand:+ start:587 stop:721 length:135 start_codon:yes stop_codon:yes gene_type:complete
MRRALTTAAEALFLLAIFALTFALLAIAPELENGIISTLGRENQ